MPPPEKAHPVNFRNELFSTKLLFPVFHFVKIQTHVSRTEDRIPAFLFLALIVFHHFDCRSAENKAGGNIDQAHKSHENIGDMP